MNLMTSYSFSSLEIIHFEGFLYSTLFFPEIIRSNHSFLRVKCKILTSKPIPRLLILRDFLVDQHQCPLALQRDKQVAVEEWYRVLGPENQ